MNFQNTYAKYFFLLLLFVLLAKRQGLAQSARRTITGVVTTAEGVRLEGVLVLIKGSDYFSGTQPDGVFYIPVSASDSVLVFSLEGYQPHELKLSDKNEYNIDLKKKNPPIVIDFYSEQGGAVNYRNSTTVTLCQLSHILLSC